MVRNLWKWAPWFVWINLFFFFFLILLVVALIPRNLVGPSSLGLTDWRDLHALKSTPPKDEIPLSIPGMVVPSKTKIVCHFSTLVLTCGQPHTLQIVPRDEYDNPTNNSASLRDEHNYSLSIHEVSGFLSSTFFCYSHPLWSTSLHRHPDFCAVCLSLSGRAQLISNYETWISLSIRKFYVKSKLPCSRKNYKFSVMLSVFLL